MAKRLPTIMTRTTIHSGYSEKLTQVSHDDICAEATPIVSNNREAHWTPSSLHGIGIFTVSLAVNTIQSLLP